MSSADPVPPTAGLRRAAPPALSAPRVSVIVLNHNGERVIAKCLDHLLAQTYDDFEIVVVDNNSADGSLAILERYLGCGRLSVVRSAANRGVAGGRNLGVTHARGAIMAFIDNDGYADPGWLSAAVKTLDSDPAIGVVASVVFFAGRRAILNGAGGTLNLQGYGGDYCFDTPYEFAHLPNRVLYAMGCGMVVRRAVLESIGPLDEKLFNYYDDSELGIRAWKSGYEVALSPDAWIDHEFGYSDRILGNKAFLCEKNRIRTVLKYFPLRRLPVWFVREISLCRKLQRDRLSIIARAWRWNLAHAPSALGLRARFAARRRPFSHLLAPSWGHYPLPCPNNQINRPDLARAANSVVMDGNSDKHHLNFGWYYAENDGTATFRWTASHASALFRLRNPALTCTIVASRPKDGEASLRIRPLGSLDPRVEETLRLPARWTRLTFTAHLPAGDYELLLVCEHPFVDALGRKLGIAVSSIHFE